MSSKPGETETPAGLQPWVGTLSDAAILEMAEAGKLITKEFNRESIKQACYELRASKTYYCPPDAVTRNAEDYILLKPKQIVVVITLESIDLPSDILGRILTKGQLFSIGLLPVNTYADPGFSGRLGIVLCNFSNNYLKITPGDPIAKIEFSKLDHPVQAPYRGQHGYETQIWPIQHNKILSAEEIEECKKKGRIGDRAFEVENSHGKMVGEVLERILVFERRLLILTSLYVLASLAIIAFAGGETVTWATINLSVGVAGSIITMLISSLVTNLRRK